MKKLIFLLVVFCCVLISCRKDKTILFDTGDPLALAPDISWALIVEPYAAFRIEPGWQAEVKSHGRKKDILRVRGKKIVDSEIWYKFEEGWLPDSAITIYTNKYKAQTALNGIK